VRVHLQLPSKTKTSHVSVISKNRSRTRTRTKKTLRINKYIYIILCRQESRENLPLQLPLYSLSFSLTLNIKTHDLSPNLSPPCIYFSCKQLYYTLAVSNYTILIVKLYNCVCTGRVPDPTSLFLPTSFCM
jgi:hypothetical protein